MCNGIYSIPWCLYIWMPVELENLKNPQGIFHSGSSTRSNDGDVSNLCSQPSYVMYGGELSESFILLAAIKTFIERCYTTP